MGGVISPNIPRIMRAYAIIPVNLWEYCNNPKIEQNANVPFHPFLQDG
jgi:hypothetical protein